MRKIGRSFWKRWALLSPIKIVTVHGITYKVDCRELIDCDIYLGGWEPETHGVLGQFVTEGMTVLEVGANIGAHTMTLGKLVGSSGKVHAIEPTEYAFAKLKQNLDLNPQLGPRVSLHQCLLSSETSASLKETVKSSWKRTKAPERPDEVVELPCYSVDDLLDIKQVEKLDFLKIDVDGYDLKVLQGAQKALQTHRPVVFVEICNWALEQHGQHGLDILSFMNELGYKGFKNGTRLDPISPEDVTGLPEHGGMNGLFLVP